MRKTSWDKRDIVDAVALRWPRPERRGAIVVDAIQGQLGGPPPALGPLGLSLNFDDDITLAESNPRPPLTCPPAGAPIGPYAENVCIVLDQSDVGFDGNIVVNYSGTSGKNVYISASEPITAIAPPGSSFAFPPGALSLDGGGGSHWIWIDTSLMSLRGSDTASTEIPRGGPSIWIGAFGAVDTLELLIDNERYGDTGNIDGYIFEIAVEFTGPITTPTCEVLSGRLAIIGLIENEI